jgi:hypothetical protein
MATPVESIDTVYPLKHPEENAGKRRILHGEYFQQFYYIIQLQKSHKDSVKLIQLIEQQQSQNPQFKSLFRSSQIKNHQSELELPQHHHQEHYHLPLTSIATAIN